jgi:hypothetical protein
MALFGKKAPAVFTLPLDLRGDLRSAIDTSPLDASTLLRSPDAEPALQALNERVPVNETVSALVYCLDQATGARGYLALSDRSLIVALTTVAADPKVIAIPVTDISQFTHDIGHAFVQFGDPVRQVIVAFPYGGTYSRGVCESIEAAVDKASMDPYSL